MDAYEFIILARKLLKDKQHADEPKYRTVISRLYYGTIHILKIINKIQIRDKGRFHSELEQILKEKDFNLGNLVGNFKEYRVKADYLLNQEVTPLDVEDSIKIYERLLEHSGFL